MKCYLEYTGPVRCSPGIQKVVLSRAYKPFAYRNRVSKKVVFIPWSESSDLCYRASNDTQETHLI